MVSDQNAFNLAPQKKIAPCQKPEYVLSAEDR
jgi:hypothetical protein